MPPSDSLAKLAATGHLNSLPLAAIWLANTPYSRSACRSMPIRRQFLTWSQPFLPQLCDWLGGESVVDEATGIADYSELLVVLPTRSAVRRLTELLVDATGGRMLPPDLMTPAEFPERLYALKQPLATAHTQRLAWVRAIRTTDPDRLRRVIPNPPDDADTRGWFALADLLAAQHRELARDDLDFLAVSKRLAELPDRHEIARWNTLAEIERSYLDDQLAPVGLWDQQKARLTAIDYDECRSKQRLVLAGMSDLNLIVRRMVEQAAAAEPNPASVTALVHADEAEAAELFDELGVLIADAWADVPIAIPDDAICRADDDRDQVEAAAVAVVTLDGVAANEIAIGCPDEQVVEPLRTRLLDAGIASNPTVGRDLSRSQPAELLRRIAACLTDPDAEATMRLVRLPCLRAMLDDQTIASRAMAELDRYRASRQPRRLTAERLAAAHESEQQRTPAGIGYETALAVLLQIETMLEPFTGGAEPVSEWRRRIMALQTALFVDPEDSESRLACEAIGRILLELTQTPPEFEGDIRAEELLGHVLDQLRGIKQPPFVEGDAVAITGWLEMPLDDRPVAVVTTFNDGTIPTAVTSDLFLPGSVRSQIGMNDNARRYARDAYATLVLLKSRKACRFVVASRNADGDPLPPSRLLFRESPERTAARVLSLIGPAPVRPRPASRWVTERTRCAIDVPPPRPRAGTVRRIPVTAFRDYLACSYRYYLGRELGLVSVERELGELDPLAFGSLVHEVLERFAQSEVRDATEADPIRRFVAAELDTLAASLFGAQPQPAIAVQLQQAHSRLAAFAEPQATWRAKGWQIAESEQNVRRTVSLPSGGRIDISGRVDRVDRNERTGEIAVIDYKTGDTATKPLAAHYAAKGETPRDRWKDLQLPLYRHLLGYADEEIVLGYFNLPKDRDGTAFCEAGFTAEQLDEADSLAWEIAEAILAESFAFDADRSVAHDSFETICQSKVLKVRPRSEPRDPNVAAASSIEGGRR